MLRRGMEADLCDDLLREVIRRLPPYSYPSVALVCKRWLAALRSSISSLRVRVPSADVVCLSSLLSHYPFLSDLTVFDVSDGFRRTSSSAGPCGACLCPVPDAPLSSAALLSCASSFPRIVSLQLTSLRSYRRPSLFWLAALPSLKSLSLIFVLRKSDDDTLCTPAAPDGETDRANDEDDDSDDRVQPALPLERLSLTGIRAADVGFPWLWHRCGNLRWLQLRACEGTGDGDSSEYGSFVHCLHDGLLGLELRTCNAIANRVLRAAADRCHRLASLLLYDGAGGDALSYFLHRRGAFLHTLDLRLPLDLQNGHLLAIAGAEGGPYKLVGGHGNLVALRLESSCLVTGDGLRPLMEGPAGAAIEELALVNCNAVEREAGLLLLLAQSMPRLRRLDLSYNDVLTAEEVGAMLPSCKNLVEIRLRGCGSLTGSFIAPMIKHCGCRIEVVDIARCPVIGISAVETLVLNASRLNHIMVEESKLSKAAKAWLRKRAVRFGVD